MCPKPAPLHSSCSSISLMRHAVTPFIILVENCMHPPVNIPFFLQYLQQIQAFVIPIKVSNSSIATAQNFDSDYSLLGCHAVLPGRWARTFRMNLLPPCWSRRFQHLFSLLCRWMPSFCEIWRSCIRVSYYNCKWQPTRCNYIGLFIYS